MKNLKFKTTINCPSCIAIVKPHLDNAIGENNWNVDTTDKNKILIINSETTSQEAIIKLIQNIGYEIEALE